MYLHGKHQEDEEQRESFSSGKPSDRSEGIGLGVVLDIMSGIHPVNIKHLWCSFISAACLETNHLFKAHFPSLLLTQLFS